MGSAYRYWRPSGGWPQYLLRSARNSAALSSAFNLRPFSFAPRIASSSFASRSWVADKMLEVGIGAPGLRAGGERNWQFLDCWLGGGRGVGGILVVLHGSELHRSWYWPTTECNTVDRLTFGCGVWVVQLWCGVEKLVIWSWIGVSRGAFRGPVKNSGAEYRETTAYNLASAL